MKYYLLDSRAGIMAADNNGELETPDNSKYILLIGTLKECCKAANNGSYGEHNVVSDEHYNILWQLCNEHGHWISKRLRI